MATIETIRDQLAFIAEFGNHARGTHVGTRIDLYPYVTDTRQPIEDLMAGVEYRPYALNEAGLELAQQSPLHHCFAWLTANGFKVEASRGRRSGNFIPFYATDGSGHTAFVSSWSSVWVNRRVPGQPGAKEAFDGKTRLKAAKLAA